MRVISPTSPAPTLKLNREVVSQIIGTGGHSVGKRGVTGTRNTAELRTGGYETKPPWQSPAREQHRPIYRRTPPGTVKFSGRMADLVDETRRAELPRIPLSRRDHQPRRLAVSPLRCELSRCRRSLGPTRHHGVLRSDPAVVPHVRFSIRSPAQASTGPTGRHLAPGRGLRHHPGTATLSLACRRSRWRLWWRRQESIRPEVHIS